MNDSIAILEINSFEFISAGASHYYGKLHCGDEKVELERKLNKNTVKDFKDQRYAVGGKTQRFNSEKHLLIYTLRVWKKIFPNAKVLLIGSSAYLDPQKCIAGDKILKKKINNYYKRAEEIGFYEGNEKEMTKISNEYMKEILEFKINS
jgi:hypothetical protein